jgi:hypothetical protein
LRHAGLVAARRAGGWLLVVGTDVADSAGVTETQVPQLVRARPQKATKIAWTLAVLVVVIMTAIGFALHGTTDGGSGVFHSSDQIAMILLGLLAGLGILLFTRPRVEADATGIRVRNLMGGYEVPWEVVRAVQFGKGSPWATLELRDDDLVTMMAVQAADKGYAVKTVRALRVMLAASQTGSAVPPPAAQTGAPVPPPAA